MKEGKYLNERAGSTVWLCGQVRKCDWTEQGQLLKARINTKLYVFQATSKLKIKSLGSLDSNAKSSKEVVARYYCTVGGRCGSMLGFSVAKIKNM